MQSLNGRGEKRFDDVNESATAHRLAVAGAGVCVELRVLLACGARSV
jgi:hypothetical protein